MSQYLDANYKNGKWDIVLMDTELGERYTSRNESFAIAMGNCLDFAVSPDAPSSIDWNEMTVAQIKEVLDNAKR